ncbi:hypothetical protein FQR65_LT02736 [Abscondita terminalis]|nr:hypothetical protein FQR65_LT02736 [Abscondita terminalis]
MYSDFDSDSDVSYIMSNSDYSDSESSYSSTDEEEVIDAVQMDDWTTIMDPFEDKVPRRISEFQSNYNFHPAIDFEDCKDAVNCFEALDDDNTEKEDFVNVNKNNLNDTEEMDIFMDEEIDCFIEPSSIKLLDWFKIYKSFLGVDVNHCDENEVYQGDRRTKNSYLSN